jgi:hypothetical protein
MRRALIDEVKRAKAKELEKEMDKVKPILSKTSEDIWRSIREDREGR